MDFIDVVVYILIFVLVLRGLSVFISWAEKR